MRFGYAVEYDFAPPTQLRPTLETKPVARPLLRRPDQRHDRLRGGRRAGADRRDQRRARGQGRAAVRARSLAGVYRRPDRRPGHAGRRRALSHVHQPRRVSAAAPARQRRPPAHRAGPSDRPGRRRAVETVRATPGRDRPAAQPARRDAGRRRDAVPGSAPAGDDLGRPRWRSTQALATKVSTTASSSR